MQLELIQDRLSDGELLGRYCDSADQQAFAGLVERYEPMVKRVCRQVMSSNYEADDAAQQVFVALSEKAYALRAQVSVASWLYRVAWNISSKTRRALAIRAKHERSGGETFSGGDKSNLPEPDAKLILQQAICDLPEMYRDAIVLHYFCGYTTAEAAARLRCPAGTVAARVSRGLQQLRRRLSDRDLVLTGVAIKLILLAMSSRSKAAVVAAAAAKGGAAATALAISAMVSNPRRRDHTRSGDHARPELKSSMGQHIFQSIFNGQMRPRWLLALASARFFWHFGITICFLQMATNSGVCSRRHGMCWGGNGRRERN